MDASATASSTAVQDTATGDPDPDNAAGAVDNHLGDAAVTPNHFQSADGVSSVANNCSSQDVDGTAAGLLTNEMQVLEGVACLANNEIQGCEGPAPFDPSDGQLSSSAFFIGPLANPSLAVQSRYIPKDVKDPMAVQGSCGLHNLGNTCFMNSGLQCLASCSPLLRFFMDCGRYTPAEPQHGTLTGAFYQLLCKMWSGRYSVVQPTHFKDLLGLYHPQFQDFRQHDCQEFLALLLDTFHEQLNQTLPLLPPPPAPSSSPSSSSATTTPSTAVMSAADPQGHLNNGDLTSDPSSSPLSSSGGKAEEHQLETESLGADVGSKLLCPESLSSEEEPGGGGGVLVVENSGGGGEVPMMRSSGQGQSASSMAPGEGRSSSLKRASTSLADAVMVAMASEDSNHSTVSAHSTDSEQSSYFKKLKIEADGGSPGSGTGSAALSSVSETCDTLPETSSSTTTTTSSTATAASFALAAAGGSSRPKAGSGSDDNNSAESGMGSMEMSPPSNCSMPQRKCVKLDLPIPPSSATANTAATQSQDPSPSISNSSALEALAKPGPDEAEPTTTRSQTHRLHLVNANKFNNTDADSFLLENPVSSSLSATATTTTTTTTHQNDLPAAMAASTSSPQDSSQTNPLHFYCKETKTLNTNVLVSNYSQGRVSMDLDSEKFAKVDNRSQVPVSKEVNLLHEALHGMEEDKVEKALICKNLGNATMLGNSSSSTTVGNTTGNTLTSTNNLPAGAGSLEGKLSLSHASNLVMAVKTRPLSGHLRKPACADPNLLNNSYDYEDEGLGGYSALVGTSLLHKGPELGPRRLECVKPDLDGLSGVAQKMELAADLVSSEVEKNVQMQAMSKLKATLTKSNIREDISDKASTSESTETEDGDMEAEAESSASEEDEKDNEEDEEDEELASPGRLRGDHSALPNPARCFTAADVATANASWGCYTARNNSFVVDTFQGQFKSTVVCAECDHVSVTYEPFMYLSLPIPYAMERQICVVFVRPHKTTVRYMLTLHKNDKVLRLRRQLQTMTATETSDVILAEVLDNHISRLLEDNVMLRYVNDTNRAVFAFQMLPPPETPLNDQQQQQQQSPLSTAHSPPPPPDPLHRPHLLHNHHHHHSIPPPPSSSCEEDPLSMDVDFGGSSLPPHQRSPPSSPLLLSMDKINTMLSDGALRSRSQSRDFFGPSGISRMSPNPGGEEDGGGNVFEQSGMMSGMSPPNSSGVGGDDFSQSGLSMQVASKLDSGDSLRPAGEEEEEEESGLRLGEGDDIVDPSSSLSQQQQHPDPDPLLMGTGMWDWTGRGSHDDRAIVNNVDDDDDIDILLDHHHQHHHHHHHHRPCVSAPPASPTSQHSGTFLPPDLNLNAGDYSSGAEGMFPQSPSSMDVEMDHVSNSVSAADFASWPGSMGGGVGEEVGGGGGGGKGEGDAGGGGGCGGAGASVSAGGVGVGGVMDQWQTCAICLEELMDSQLLTHQSCAGVFCHTCLEMSAKHSGDLKNCCPICLCPVDVSLDFVPLASSSTIKCKIRILAVPITFRHSGDGSWEEVRLVCGPRLTYVASQQDAATLHALVDRVVPFAANYTLHFTDGQGLRCSRCEFGAHCWGCEVSKEGEVSLQPGDTLTVHFIERLSGEEVEDKMHVSQDASLQHLRSSDPISIFDCFDAFTQSEVLDEHNPWYCPCCRRNQCAKKTMTVWRYPENLIIHLKRFVYEDLSSTKIDNRVVFPHTSLDVTPFLAGPTSSFNVYDLYSIVCHHGGANAGHYTSFSCHPMTSTWYNYNDETVTQQSPGDAEFDSSYVLFYKRQGPKLEFDLVKDIPLSEDEEAGNTGNSVDFSAPGSMAVVAYQPPSPSPPPTTTTDQATTPSDVVTFETEGFSILSDHQTPEESRINFDFYCT